MFQNDLPSTHLSLDHVVAFVSHLKDKIVGVYHLLLPGSLEFHIDGDEAPSSTDTSAAVNKDQLLIAVGMGVSDPPQEVEQGGGVTGDSEIRPRDEVELPDFSHFL